MYEVTIDFGDDALQVPHICKTETELGLYLERVPSMFGFAATGQANIKVKRKRTYSHNNKETPAP